MRTALESFCTSSGSAWSRPSSAAYALAARNSINPARGLAPSSTRGSERVASRIRTDVAPQGLAPVHGPGRSLSCEHVRHVGHGLEIEHAVALGVVEQHLGLLVGARVAERDAHHETVELRLRQRVGALVLDGILGGDHHERRRQLVCVLVDRHTRSCMHSSSPDCVLGEARLTSSTSTTFANTGPGRNSKRFSRWL